MFHYCEKIYKVFVAAAKEVERFRDGEIKQGELDMQFYWDIIREIGKNKRDHTIHFDKITRFLKEDGKETDERKKKKKIK